MSIKAIVFDLDGTLVDSYPGIQESLNHMLSHFGLPPVDSQTIRKMVGRGMENLIRQVVDEDRLPEGIRVFKESYDRTVLSGTFLLPEVMATLQELRQAGIKMGVASNKPADYSRMILQHLGLAAWLDETLGPDQQIPPKPDPKMLHALLRKLQAETTDSLYVGDMALDVQTARNAGVSVALVPGGGDEVELLEAAHPDYLLKAFSELQDLIG